TSGSRTPRRPRFGPFKTRTFIAAMSFQSFQLPEADRDATKAHATPIASLLPADHHSQHITKLNNHFKTEQSLRN
ncbi:MAG: hypothetical protein ABF515_10040, partial [Bifidobacterium sp.]